MPKDRLPENSPSQSTKRKGDLRLPAGRHTFEIRAAIQPGTDPLKTFRVNCVGAAFADKGILKPASTKLPAIRLAYPIHKRGQFDCHTFRIPAIARAKDGSLLAVYDLRYNSRRDLQEHMDIGLSRSTDGGITWSKDHGTTWTVSSHARDNTTECAVAELSDGSLLLNMRDNRNRADKSDTNGRAMAQTKDLGKSWAIHPADHGALPEPTCMASMISHTLIDGHHVLIFSNPHNRHGRKHMTLRLSFDDGKTWPSNYHLLLDSKGGAYSSLVMVDDDTIGILYESSQADMVFQKIALSELIR